MREVTVAATQMACEWDRRRNLERAEHLVRTAAGRGARVILLQELFETPLLLQGPGPPRTSGWPSRSRASPLIARMSRLASELGVVLPISFFERANNAYFNSLAVIDADGRVLGVYRKSHIPDGPGYQEKFYFNPGDTGFRVWQTKAGVIGVGICWDQWFPEAARIMALLGAEVLLYPTAIGSEPHDTGLRQPRPLAARHAGPRRRQHDPGRRVQPHRHRGGRRAATLTFYGSSFIADDRGANGRGGAARGRGGADRHLRPRRRSRTSAPPGACSATGGPTSTSRS